MMNGPRRARHWINDFLSADIPTRLIGYRDWWNLSESQLPTPTKFLTYEPVAIDAWPMVYTVVLSTTSVERFEYDFDENPKYEITHSMRTYVWGKAVNPEPATDLRDDLVVVIRDALMDLPAVSSYNQTQTDCSAVIEEGSIREEFSDLTLIKGDRFLAGGYIQYDIVMTEVVSRDPLGTISVIPSVIVQLIEKVPNAPTLVTTLVDTADQIGLLWKAPSWDGGGFGVDGYKVEQSTDGGDTWTVTTADTGTNSPQYTVTGLTTGDTYLFRVAGFNENGTGATSAQSLLSTVP